MNKSLSLIAMAAALGLAATPAFAGNDSAYTDIDLDNCTVMETFELGASFACPGYKGYPVWVAEDDLRDYVSYGFGAPGEMAAHQTLPSFNRLGGKIEWRLTEVDGSWKPFATILRWITEPGDGSAGSEILIVTKLAPGNTCQIAYVDTRLVSMPGDNPNEIARNFADTEAESFDCTHDDPLYYPS